MSDMFPYQHGAQETNGESMLYKMMRAVRESRAIQLGVEEANEVPQLPHKHMCRIVNGMNYAIRWCTVPGCMQTWRLSLRYDDFEDPPAAAWERIEEPADLLSPVLPDYED